MPLLSCMAPGPAIGIARTVCFHVNEQPRFQNVTEFSPIVARSGALVRSSLGPIVPADLLATAEAPPEGADDGATGMELWSLNLQAGPPDPYPYKVALPFLAAP